MSRRIDEVIEAMQAALKYYCGVEAREISNFNGILIGRYFVDQKKRKIEILILQADLFDPYGEFSLNYYNFTINVRIVEYLEKKFKILEIITNIE